jgi:hypothetical protein
MTSHEGVRQKMEKRAQLYAAALIVCTALTMCLPATAAAGSPIPKYAQKVAGGQDGANGSWSVWLFGHHGADQCWATKTTEGHLKNEDALCGFSVPARPWQLAAKGTSDFDDTQESHLFFLARKNVASLKVRVEKARGRESWIHLQTHRLTSAVAKRAQIVPNFSYAAGSFTGPLKCVGRVISTTRSGKRFVGSESNSCAA